MQQLQGQINKSYQKTYYLTIRGQIGFISIWLGFPEAYPYFVVVISINVFVTVFYLFNIISLQTTLLATLNRFIVSSLLNFQIFTQILFILKQPGILKRGKITKKQADQFLIAQSQKLVNEQQSFIQSQQNVNLSDNKNQVKKSSSFNKYRYCQSCKIVKPPYCFHCKYCNICVRGFDQQINIISHSSIFANCVGQNNFKLYLLVILQIFLLRNNLSQDFCMFPYTLSNLLRKLYENDYGFVKALSDFSLITKLQLIVWLIVFLVLYNNIRSKYKIHFILFCIALEFIYMLYLMQLKIDAFFMEIVYVWICIVFNGGICIWQQMITRTFCQLFLRLYLITSKRTYTQYQMIKANRQEMTDLYLTMGQRYKNCISFLK